MPCQVPYPLSCHVCPFVATLLQASGRLGTTPEGGQKTLPHCPCFFQRFKTYVTYIIIYYHIYIICSDPGNQGYFGKNDKSSIEWPRSSNESSKAKKTSAAGYTAPVSVLWRCPPCSCGHTPSAWCPLIRLYFYHISIYLVYLPIVLYQSGSVILSAVFAWLFHRSNVDRHFKDHESRLMR